MTPLRYAQFCPLARSAEILGERWTLLLVRELLLGGKRFADLRRGLGGVSASVLSSRLDRLEELGLVRRRTLPPPAASTLYELTEAGRGLEPVLLELTRWGVRFLGSPAEGDQVEPAWLELGCRAFARRDASPPRRFRIELPAEEGVVRFAVRGGPLGTAVLGELPDPEATLRCEPLVLMSLMSGLRDPDEARRSGALEIEGDASRAAEFADLFDLRPAVNPRERNPS